MPPTNAEIVFWVVAFVSVLATIKIGFFLYEV